MNCWQQKINLESGYKYPHDHEGIEREEVRTTSGVRWSQEELKEYIENMPMLKAIEEMRGNKK